MFGEHDSLIPGRENQQRVESRSMKIELERSVPELPVRDVEKAQLYYRDILGFQIEWIVPEKEFGAVANRDCILFLRRRSDSFEPSVNWIFAPGIDELYADLKTAGALITDDIEDKPWGLRQFTIEDLDGNRFHFHHDL